MIQVVTLSGVGRSKASAGQYILPHSWFFEVLKFCEHLIFMLLFSQMANLKSSHDPMHQAKCCIINILIFWPTFR